LILLSLNCQSIIAKKAEFQAMVDSHCPDVICVTESWLNSSHRDGEIGNPLSFSTSYDIHRRDRIGRQGGGVLVAVRKELMATRQLELETDCENVWIKLDIANSRDVFICAYYRPNVNDVNSNQALASSLERLPRNCTSFITGDFNYPGFSWPDSNISATAPYKGLHSEFLATIHDHGLEQMVCDPTRDGNILDLLLTNDPMSCIKTEVIPGISDHEAILTSLDVKVKRITQAKRQIPQFSKADWISFNDHMRPVSQQIISSPSSTTTEDLWTIFRDAIYEGVKKFVPHKEAKTKKPKPWILRRTLRLIGKRNRHFAQYRNTGSRYHKAKYAKCKAQAQKEIRSSYWTYLEDITHQDNDQGKCSKQFWSFIKHARSDGASIPDLKSPDGSLTTDPKGKANLLNLQFKSVFSPPSDRPSSAYTSRCPRMCPIRIQESGVDKLLSNLDERKAPGPDGISPAILKNLRPSISSSLRYIFQHSLDTGCVPTDWRCANVSPVYKKGNRSDPANYRPISLTAVCCKIMEHVIVSSVMNHLDNHQALHPNQHGFRKGLSCETQLIEFSHALLQTMHSGHQTDIVVLDFAKAFDKVNHSKLIAKLEAYGIDTPTTHWIKSFLSQRSQSVVLDGVRSDSVPVTSGVPQGSVLGPALFLIYINDLPSCVASSVRLFADDTVLYRQVETTEDCEALQADLDALAKWEEEWDMKFHPAKCQVMHVHRKRSPLTHTYILHDTELQSTDHVKYLGVTLSHDMSWSRHISDVSSRANRALGFVRRNVKLRSPKIKEQIYKAIVRPHTEYAATVWAPHEAKHIQQLEMVQRRAARWTLNRHHNTSSVDRMLADLSWRSLAQRRTDSRLLMMFKITHSLVQVPQAQYLQPPPHTAVRRNHSLTYSQIPARTNYLKYSFFPATVMVWNKLPNHLVNAPNINSFKSQVARLEHPRA